MSVAVGPARPIFVLEEIASVLLGSGFEGGPSWA